MDQQCFRRFFGDGEADGVGDAILGQTRAGMGIAKVARLKLAGSEVVRLMAGHSASATPGSAKRKAGGMRQGKIVGANRWSEERASHRVFPARFYAGGLWMG